MHPANFDPALGSVLKTAVMLAVQVLAGQSPWKRPCVAATTADVTIATALNAGDSIDGVTLADGDRVLVWQQTDASENGIYIVSAAPTRAADFDASDEILGALVPVVGGSTYAASVFLVANTAAITVDTDDIDLVRTSSPLTTKGDLWGFDSADARIPVGADNDALIADSGEDLGLAWRPSARHAHVVGEPFVGDASQTVFYLANEAEYGSVAAYDANGARVGITQDTTELDKVTFDSAPAAGAGFLDYIPATAP